MREQWCPLAVFSLPRIKRPGDEATRIDAHSGTRDEDNSLQGSPTPPSASVVDGTGRTDIPPSAKVDLYASAVLDSNLCI